MYEFEVIKSLNYTDNLYVTQKLFYLYDRNADLRARLQARKDRSKKRDLKDADGLTEQEKQVAMSTMDAQLAADRQREDNAMIDALAGYEQVIIS